MTHDTALGDFDRGRCSAFGTVRWLLIEAADRAFHHGDTLTATTLGHLAAEVQSLTDHAAHPTHVPAPRRPC